MLGLPRSPVLISIAAVVACAAAAVPAQAAPAAAGERLAAAQRLEAEGDIAGAADTLDEILSTGGALDPATRSAVGSEIARLRLVLGDYTAAMEAATAAAADAELAGNRSAQGRAEFLVGMVHRLLQQLDEAGRAFRASARLARDTGDTDLYLQAVNEEGKEVNDRFGHDAGDEVLRDLAGRLRDGVRAVDLAGRWGGEEFLLVLPDTDDAGAAELAEKLRRAVAARPLTVGDLELALTLTFGVAAHEGGPVEDTVRRADEALYRGKRAGRDRVSVA
ncbi:MAG TPA: diguanylate cyclase [Methylomirabilota bacterium]|nr:diguanylate cyclase [Methylomirabilota bacterium]